MTFKGLSRLLLVSLLIALPIVATAQQANPFRAQINPAGVTATAATNGANTTRITITMKDNRNNTITQATYVELFLSDVNGCSALSATSASGAVTASTGALLTTFTAKLHLSAVTSVGGVLGIDIVDTAKTNWKVCLRFPNVGIQRVLNLATASFG